MDKYIILQYNIRSYKQIFQFFRKVTITLEKLSNGGIRTGYEREDNDEFFEGHSLVWFFGCS